ncbi:MAG: hypothetical protein U5K79_13595, partial [Cyclobacteriaceae bacterium]|nr:hypothetical protein [Cyclobacteriaceae bacterium]
LRNVLVQLRIVLRGRRHASSPNDRAAVELMKEQAIGKIQHVYLCSDRPGANNTESPVRDRQREQEPPSNLNWEIWDPAQRRLSPMHLIYTIPMLWRSWQDFGTG